MRSAMCYSVFPTFSSFQKSFRWLFVFFLSSLFVTFSIFARGSFESIREAQSSSPDGMQNLSWYRSVKKEGAGVPDRDTAFRIEDYAGIWRDRPQYRLFILSKKGDILRRTCRTTEEFIVQKRTLTAGGVIMEGQFARHPDVTLNLDIRRDGKGGITINGTHVTQESSNPDDRDLMERLMVIMCI